MGRKFDEVQEEEQRVPYKVVKAANGDAHVQVEVNGQRKTFSPPEISAMILVEAESRRGSEARRKNHAGGHHRSGVFQRLAAQRDQRRGQDRRS